MDESNDEIGSYNYDDKMWIEGWTLGKYEKEGILPDAKMSDFLIDSWIEGFVKGAVEMCQYQRLYDYMSEVIKDKDTLNLVRDTYFKK